MKKHILIFFCAAIGSYIIQKCLVFKSTQLLESITLLEAVSDRRTFEDTSKWWQSTLIYHLYPRSHKDSDGNGIGDLLGIESTLDYLVDLGVGAVWISPIYKSPMVDFGYDISNFKEIDPMFGNMNHFDSLMVAMKKRGLKVILDFVPNHTSDQHEWFQKSILREDPYTNYYVWKNASRFEESGNLTSPNNWVSVFGGSAWTWNEQRQQFYFHQYTIGQPDLNYANPAVLQDMFDVMRFWLDKGVDGFRMDAVHRLFEDQQFKDEPINPNRDNRTSPREYSYWKHIYIFSQPENFNILAKYREFIDAYFNKHGNSRLLSVNAFVPSLDEFFKYYGTLEKPLADFPYNFEFIMKLKAPLNASKVLNILIKWFRQLPKGASSSWMVGSHGFSRVSTRFGNDSVDAMNMICLLLPGTAVTYYGEEIGMQDTFYSWEQTKDVKGLQAGPDKYLKYSRDPCRSPMQWNSTVNAGFSTANETWIKVNSNYKVLNVAAQLTASHSHLSVYKNIALLRKSDAWNYGGLAVAALNDDQVFAFTRTFSNGTGFVVIINFGDNLETVNAKIAFKHMSTVGTVYTKNVNFNPTSTVIGSIVNTSELRLGPKSSLILTL